jgi:hypothetical protein
MFGGAMAMRTFDDDSDQLADDFCFRIFLARAPQPDATPERGNSKVPLRRLTLTSRGLARTFGAIMTSISATSGSGYLSPLQQLQAELQSEVNSGAISSSDQSALSAALTDINSSLQAGSASNPGGGTNSPPGDLKTKIDNLIAGEVSSGKLTSAQATELQGVFQAAFAGGPADSSEAGTTVAAGAADAAAPSGPPPGGAHGARHGHHGGHGGSSSTSSSSSSTGGSSDTSSADDILQQFLQSLQDSLSSSSQNSYSATGSAASDSASSVSALLINYQT